MVVPLCTATSLHLTFLLELGSDTSFRTSASVECNPSGLCMTSCLSTLAIFPIRIAVFHCVGGPPSESCRLVFYESHNHAVEVEEEHDQVEAELDERFLENK
jgi:hypothetical protein